MEYGVSGKQLLGAFEMKKSGFRKFARTITQLEEVSFLSLKAFQKLAKAQERLNYTKGRLGKLPSNEQIIFDSERYVIFLESEETTLRQLSINHKMPIRKIKQIVEDVSNW